MESQNKPYGRSTQGVKRESLCDDTEERRSSQLMAKQTTKSRVNSGIKVMCGTMFLHSKEGQFIMVCSGLQKIKPSHHQR